MKKLLLLKLLLFTAYYGFAQTTYDMSYVQNAGYPGGIRPTSSSTTETSGWTTILPGSAAANSWSPSQTLPFAFNFFGQPVTNFKASANMLVTFDVANAALPNANTNLPTATLPNNTIAAFWDEFTNAQPTGSNDVVHTRVFGTAPNRQLWIVWFSFEYGNPNISFAYNGVVLEETTNKVYAVNIYNAGTNSLATTVGLQQNSTNAVQFGTDQLPLGSNSSANVADVDYYQFSPRLLVAADASVTALVTPTTVGCFTAAQPVEVTIKNFGTAPISNVPVGARITGGVAPQTITGTYAGTLAPNATANVVIGNANMAAAGTYTIKAYTALAADGFTANDTLPAATRIVEPLATLPQAVDFTGYNGSNLSTLSPGWREAEGATSPTGTTSDDWFNSDFGNVAGGVNGVSARLNIYTLGMNDWIVGPKVLATASTALKFDLALTLYGSTNSATLGSDDQLKVMISTDCGLTWTAIRTYSAATPISNVGQTEQISLSAYAGQEIITAFLATEGTVDDPEDVDLFLDNIFLGTPPIVDMGVTALVAPEAVGCYTAAQDVIVSIHNFLNQPIDFSAKPATITVNVTGAATQTLTATVNSGTLAAGASQNVTVGTLNMTASGNYVFNSSISATDDGNPTNDALAAVTRTVTPVATLPQSVDFTGFTGSNLSTVFPGWKEQTGATMPSGTSSSWSNATGMGGATNVSARLNIYSTGKNEWIVGPKILATANTALKFDLALTLYGSTNSATLGSDDQLKVMISTDCGDTWTAIRTYSAATPISNVGQTEQVSLAAYAGQEIITAFLATEGTVNDPEDVYLYLDNIFIGTPPALDMGLSSLVSPVAAGCYTAAHDVIVALENYSYLPIDFATNPATITVNVTGAATQTLTVTLNSGTLAPGVSQNVTVGTLNMTTVGTYTFNGSVSVTGDGNPANDALTAATRSVTPVATLPQSVDFTGFTGSNLTTVFPEWKEQAGATMPSGTSSSWSNSTGLGGANNVTARINLYSTGKNEWIVGPKVVATTNTFFKFKAAITDFFALLPYSGSMDSDDKVQVMISADCGQSFTPLFTLEAANTSNLTNVLTEYSVPLSTYAGQQVILAIRATEGTTSGTQDYDFHVDDLSVVDMPPLDLGAVALASPVVNTGCYGNAEPVSLTITNFGATAVDFVATPATLTVNVTGAVTQPFTLVVNNNTANGGAALAPNASVTIPLGTLNMQTLGTYTFNGNVAVTGDGNTANNAITAATIVVVSPVAGTASASPVSLCNSGTTTLSLTGNNGGDIQWQSATSLSGTFTNIAGATGPTFTTGNLTATTFFQAVVSCGTSSVTSNQVTVTVNNPLVTASTGATVCSGGTATISATPSAGATISWYSAATGGTPLASGNTYSPVVTGPVTYYAQASIGSGSGLTSLAAHPLTGGNGCGGGSMFNVNPISNLMVTGFDQNLTASSGSSVTVNVHYKTGSYLGSETTASAWTLHQTVTVTSAGQNTATSIPINALSLTAGQNYAFYIEADVQYTTISAPITYTNADLNIVVGAGLCSSFGNINANRAWNGVLHYTAGCPGPRVPVAVTISSATAAPTVTAATATTFCAGDSVQLTATSAVSGATFEWKLNGNAIAGATAANFVAYTGGSYTAVAIDNGCPSPASTPVVITVNPKPATPTITSGGGSGHTLTSSATTGNQWLLNGTPISGATSQTYTATANGNYAVVVTDNGCSSDTSAIVNITNTGIKGDLAGMSVSVYPNPNNGQFSVKLEGYNQGAALELYSLTGQLIVKETAKAGKQITPMQVKNLAAGTYLLKVISEKGVQISKLIVE